MEKLVRINKFLSSAGCCSRRKADELIKAGKVIINGKKATLGDTVSSTDIVEVDGVQVEANSKKIYLKYYKPRGVICTHDKDSPNSILNKINIPDRVYPIGRLDVASEGLILLTNDGELANRIMHPKYEHEKEYEVSVDRDIENSFLEKMSLGVKILDEITLPANVKKISQQTFRIILKQGMNRQIRRMCEALDYCVTDLIRLRVMNISISGLKLGEFKKIEGNELKELLQKLGLDAIKN